MTEATAAHHQTSDESIKAERGGHIQNIRLEIPPDKLRWQSAVLIIATAFAISSFVLAFQAEREARLAEYYGIDLEVYMAKQHLQPPADPWRGKPQEK